ncbi:hypothetical protein EX30DRAFT_342682 [Ascodesmis nigricans]|uniref:Uncharacterized protein n=1 Tax=Ascodesmis nigricans TaxID=341454 RepID=A0A4S2MPG6_9PEZI|nr:hypothetical protein EX30DRAFT_342682 [Ascodesmis nigricans]
MAVCANHGSTNRVPERTKCMSLSLYKFWTCWSCAYEMNWPEWRRCNGSTYQPGNWYCLYGVEEEGGQ